MVSIKFEPGDRVRVIKGDEEDLPVGFETTVTATSVEEYSVEASTQFLDLIDAGGDPRCRPAYEFELVEQPFKAATEQVGVGQYRPQATSAAQWREAVELAPTTIERAYEVASSALNIGKVAEQGMSYGGRDVLIEAHNALVDRVAVLEAQLRSPAKHEQPPVDRATEITREAVAIWHETHHLSGGAEPDNELASLARRGELDQRKDFTRVRQYLASVLAEQSDG
jgi:hypothetical protein